MARQIISIKVEPVQKRWLNKTEAMAYLSYSEDFLNRLRAEARISFSQYGSKMIWYDIKSLDKFIVSNKVI